MQCSGTTEDYSGYYNQVWSNMVGWPYLQACTDFHDSSGRLYTGLVVS